VNELQVMVLDPGLEQILMQAATANPGEGAGLEPGLAENLVTRAQAAVLQQEQLGLPAVLLVPAPLRELLSRFLRRSIPQLKVVSHAEVPDSKVVKVTTLIGSPT
jgi:flagellar biosynthesis protein FlhA